jgi:hypothetical protein
MYNDYEFHKNAILKEMELNRVHLEKLVKDKEHILQNIENIVAISEILNNLRIKYNTLNSLSKPIMINGQYWFHNQYLF